ncbi:serine hydrolase [Variovorax paradoxus]|uniref:serine hydrolase domain-containing protein n=1 Tax=Variovorax paradoxus TaxID=34073 RepID=UPI00193447B6|nr:serine hydrolase [Variovorax paradoxus]
MTDWTSDPICTPNAPFQDGLPRARAEEKGLNPRAIEAFIEDAERLGVVFNSLMVWHSGHVIAESWWWPYRADRPHMMHSATKSFLSAAVGIALAEGRFGLQDRVVDFCPQHLVQPADARLARMTVEDLLTQTCGHGHGTSGAQWRSISTSWIAEFFKIPVVFEPGTTFRYTSATSFMLSAIITQTTGQSTHAYLQSRFLQPMGIRGLQWDMGPENVNPGGNGISCTTSDLLKLAIVHLNEGQWNGAQLLPADWIRRATSPLRGNPYGYHWWAGPSNSFYAYGVFGQFAMVFPEHDAVVAITSATPPGEETLRSVIWRHFPGALSMVGVPGLRTNAPAPILPDHSACRASPPAHLRQDSPTIALVHGKRYVASPNDDGILSVRLAFDAVCCRLHIEDARGDHLIQVGLDDWLESETTLSGAALHHGYEPGSMRVIAAGAWAAPDRFVAQLRFVETSFCDELVLSFDDREMRLERRVNVNSRLTYRPVVSLQLLQEN